MMVMLSSGVEMTAWEKSGVCWRCGKCTIIQAMSKRPKLYKWRDLKYPIGAKIKIIATIPEILTKKKSELQPPN